MRYLTGFTLGEGEEKVAGNSGQFLVSAEDVAVLADSRYTIQARREAPDARVVEAYNDLPARWPELMASVGARRVAVEAGFVSHAVVGAPRGGRPGRRARARSRAGSRPTGRSRSRPRSSGSPPPVPSPTGRWPRCSPRSGPGATEADLALRLEWLIRTGGAEALAFDVACLAGPEAALPHGAPGDRPVLDGLGPAVRLRRPGRRLSQRHDPDAVRRRAGGPRPRDLRARGARPGGGHRGARDGRRARAGGRRPAERPDDRRRRPGRHRRRPVTATISGTGPATASGLPPTRRRRSGGSRPRPRCRARRSSRSSRASTSTARWASGSRTWSLLDAAAGRVERLTRFPREVLVVGG